MTRMDTGTLKFACPNCRQHLEAALDWVGMQVECPTCGMTIAVPNAPVETDLAHEGTLSSMNVLSPSIDVVSNSHQSPPPLIRVVEKRKGFFEKNKNWMIPVAAILLVVGLAARNLKQRKHVSDPRPSPPSVGTERPRSSASATNYGTFSESRQFVKDHIRKNDNCRIVAITKTGGDIVVCGDNDWAASGCSTRITDILQMIFNKGETIRDVCLTEMGRFIVLYGKNAANWNDIPTDMEYHLRKMNDDGEDLYSATFNDAGDWIVVGSEHYACSATWLKEWLAGGAREYGLLRAAAVSSDAAVACFDGGYLFFGNVPQNLKNALREADFDVRIIKIAGSAWFFASEYGYGYRAEM